MTDDIFHGDGLLALQGCISYETSGELHVAGFCFLLGRGDDHARRGRTVWIAHRRSNWKGPPVVRDPRDRERSSGDTDE